MTVTASISLSRPRSPRPRQRHWHVPVELPSLFWTIGASGKRTPEAAAAGCVGTFGIGGFANFGVCDTLEVISKIEDQRAARSRDCHRRIFRRLVLLTPVCYGRAVRCLCSTGHAGCRYSARRIIDELRRYLHDFVRFVPTAVFFNGQGFRRARSAIEDRDNLSEFTIGADWREGDLISQAGSIEDRGHTLVASVTGLTVGGETVNLAGQVRFEGGTVDVFKRGFKLCATSVPSIIGVSGRLDCDRFVPTAGRDSLDNVTTALLSQIAQLLERVAVEAVLESARAYRAAHPDIQVHHEAGTYREAWQGQGESRRRLREHP